MVRSPIGVGFKMDRKTVSSLFCIRCGHNWLPRKANPPKECPSCHSPYYDKPRKRHPIGAGLKMKKKMECGE